VVIHADGAWRKNGQVHTALVHDAQLVGFDTLANFFVADRGRIGQHLA